MSLSTSQEMMHLERRAKDAVNIAMSRGYEPPAAFVAANAVVLAAREIADAGPAAPRPMPTKPTQVKEWVESTVRDRADTVLRQEAAAEVAATATRNSVRAVIDAIPEFLGRVCDDFDQSLAEFQRLVTLAPHAVSGHTSTEQFEMHAELLRSVEALTSAATARGQFALLTDEGSEIGSNGLWLVLAPHPSTYLGQVREIVAEFRSGFPSTIEQWQRVEQVGIGIARSGEAAQRITEFAQLQHLSGWATPDGGMIDKSYEQTRALIGDQRPGVSIGSQMPGAEVR